MLDRYPRFTVRLLFSMLYLGLVLLLTGLIYYRAQSFDGRLVVESEHSESWVARPSDGRKIFSTGHRNMPAEVIGFDNPRAAVRVLGTEASFDAIRMPFALHLDAVEVLDRPPDKDLLEVRFPEGQRILDSDRESYVDVPEGRVTLGKTTGWRGLIRAGAGANRAMVSFSLGAESWSPGIFLDADAVRRPRPGPTFLLRWFESEAAARGALPEDRPPLSPIRWGVREEGRTHWFESLTPGTGVTTNAGIAYTLLDTVVENDGDTAEITAIVVGRQDGEAAVRLRVPANRESADDALIFERHQDHLTVLLHAWRDGAAWTRAFVGDTAAAAILLNERDVLDLELPHTTARIRLDQVMGNAVIVDGSDGSVRGLTLDTPLGPLCIREGQSVQLEETGLRYRRVPQAPVTRYTLRVSAPGEETTPSFTLGPADTHRVGQWRFHHDQEHLGAERIAVLRVERIAGTPAQWFGAALFIVGALGLCFARFADWRQGDALLFDAVEEERVTEYNAASGAGDFDPPRPPIKRQ